MGDVGVRILAERSPAELGGGQPQIDELLCQSGRFVGSVAEEHAGIGTDGRTMRAAEEFRDRLAEGFAANVPQRDIRAADGVDRGAATAVAVRLVVHLLPQPLNVERILADEDRREPVPACGGTGCVEAGFADVRLAGHLADARDAGVGVDQHDQDIERAVGDFLDDGDAQVQRFDGGDAHGC